MTKTILVLAANPKNTSPLRLDQEVREIENGLERAQRRDEFILKQKWATRPIDVRRAMLDIKPHIVHFCGHGSGEEGIAFENETGWAKLVNAETLARFFELFADKLECVFLNACYSEVQAAAVVNHIPYVIGMKNAIGDTAAIEFAVAFYDALGAGESIEFAYQLACNALQWAGLSQELKPVLKTGEHPNRLSDTKLKSDHASRVQIIIQGEISSLSVERSASITDALAGLLRIPSTAIEIYHVYEGSIVLEIDIPPVAVERLRSLLQTNSTELRDLEIKTVALDLNSNEIEEWNIMGEKYSLTARSGILMIDTGDWLDTLKHFPNTEEYIVGLVHSFSKALEKILGTGNLFSPPNLVACVVGLHLTKGTIDERNDELGLLAICKMRDIPTIVVSEHIPKNMEDQLRDDFNVQAIFDRQTFLPNELLHELNKIRSQHIEKTSTTWLRTLSKDVDSLTKQLKLFELVKDYYKSAYRKRSET